MSESDLDLPGMDAALRADQKKLDGLMAAPALSLDERGIEAALALYDGRFFITEGTIRSIITAYLAETAPSALETEVSNEYFTEATACLTSHAEPGNPSASPPAPSPPQG